MTKSDLLRVQDVRDAYRLIGECRDLGADPALWYRRMLEGLCRLVGAPAVTGGEGWWLRPHGGIRVASAYESGLDARARGRFVAFMREQGPAAEPTYQALERMPGRLVTVTRPQVVRDAHWYRSGVYTKYRRPAGLDASVTSVFQVSDTGAISALHVHRAAGERDFSAREARLVNFFHEEIGPLIGRALVSDTEPSPERLSPRLHQTLVCLLDGDSEKQVAARLGLSQATTHQYVTTLYRRFGVRSRAQLLVYAMKRMGTGRWRRLPPASAQPPSPG